MQKQYCGCIVTQSDAGLIWVRRLCWKGVGRGNRPSNPLRTQTSYVCVSNVYLASDLFWTIVNLFAGTTWGLNLCFDTGNKG